MTEPDEVIRFWMDEVGEAAWFVSDAALDGQIRARFLGAWEEARAGRLAAWCGTAEGTLAFLILTDQFPRNMFRGDGLSFRHRCARPRRRRAASVARNFDLATPEPQRAFFLHAFRTFRRDGRSSIGLWP